jgi:flagellin-like hook-associated protein FlgL
MMIPSLSPSVNLFLNSLSQLQTAINSATAQLSSGYRISQPSDAPDQISPLLQLLAGLNHNQSVANNLATVQANVSSADGAVSTALQLLNQAESLGSQGATGTASQTTRANLAQQVEGIQEQMVALANTSVNGQYIFSGDQSSSQPYAMQLTNPVQIGQAAAASAILPGNTAAFQIQTASGLSTITIAGQTGDTLQSQLSELNSQLASLGITAGLSQAGYLQLQSSNAFSVSAQATGAASLVNNTAPETADNAGLNTYQFTGQAGGGSHVEITVGGISAIATLTNPAAPTQADVNAINDAIQAQGIAGVSAVLDQTAPNAISFQGTENFSISDDHTSSGVYVLDGNSSTAAVPANGVARLIVSTSTAQVELADRSFVKYNQTAQTLFDHRNPDDSIATDNVFAALNSLRVALTNNDSSAITAAQTSLHTAFSYLNAQETFYGNTLTRITAATNQISTENTNLQQQISAIRDTNVAETAVELSSAEAQSQDALAAEGKVPQTSLFDFLG